MSDICEVVGACLLGNVEHTEPPGMYIGCRQDGAAIPGSFA